MPGEKCSFDDRNDIPKSALVIYNISSDFNLGALVRTANALGAGETILVGRQKMSRTGHMGTDRGFASRRHFYRIEEAADYLGQRGFALVGVEIDEAARPVETHPFFGNTAFLMGNEGTGISGKARALCDSLVYIRQFGSGASLNVNVAAGIVLHQFSCWASPEENRIVGQKFVPDVP